MAAGDIGLSAVDPSQFASDVAYSGLADSAFGFSGDSALETDVGIQSPLQLSTMDGETIASTYDLWGNYDPSTSLALSGVTDPPFMSAAQSTPNPTGTALSDSTSSSFGFLNKVGSIFASLVGGAPRAVSPAPIPVSQQRIGYQPTHTVNGTSLSMLLIVVAAAALLLMIGDE